jgi:fructokinase
MPQIQKTWDIAALGELLVDFTGGERSPRGNPVFEANPGGAPCNVLAMAARLGRRTAFLGKVGGDLMGDFLLEAARDAGIDCRGLRRDPRAGTTLAFVLTGPGGERSFSFFRDPGADTLLTPEELDRSVLEDCRIFHFGSLSMTHQPARSATQAAVEAASAAGALVSFDPNYRPLLWDSPEDARRQMLWGAARCQVMKVAEDELCFLTGCREIPQGVQVLLGRCPGIRLLLVTRGAGGAAAFFGESVVERPAFPVEALDTTGAGDTFLGCCLSFLLDRPLDALDQKALGEMLDFASAAAAVVVVTRRGALRSMPDRAQVEALLQKAKEGIL